MIDTLAYLAGTWLLERTIEDHRTGTSGSFRGEAEVRHGRYEERGRLRLGGYDGSAHRALGLTGGGDAVAVTFLDGRPFFGLDLRAGSCSAVHLCDADRYELEFEIETPDRLLERWRVTGPAKDYEARTTWRRLDLVRQLR